ncbi:MAG: protein kinase [Acidobacteriota bacterium]
MSDSQPTLLVVDDEEMNRDLLSRRLQRKGYDVAIAKGGQEALDAVAAGGIDLILLDIMMPGIDGLQVLRTLRGRYAQNELPIIMATAKGESEDVVQALELGANDYVVKPLDFPVVLARVQAQLRSKVSAAQGDAKSTEPSAAEIKPGVVMAGKYRLDKLLGSGTFGSVFRARHLDLETDVALKVLRTGLASDGESLARFRLEGAAACRLRHPHAVAVHDFAVTEAGVPYLVMELLEGRSLDQELAGGRVLTPSRSAELLQPICEALAEAHRAGMVHRDIKPANIFLAESHGREVVKVLDFGIAKLMGETVTSQQLTQDGMLLGTPSYMSPERLENRDYDGRSDVYAVGVMLFQMLTGRLPFIAKRGDLMALVVLHVKGEAPALRELRPELSPELEGLVARTLAKAPSERPDAAGLARELADLAAHEDAAEEPSPPPALAPGEEQNTEELIASLAPTLAVDDPTAGQPRRGVGGWFRRLFRGNGSDH